MEQNRDTLKTKYPAIEDFKSRFVIDDQLMQEVMDYAHKEGVKDSVDFNFSGTATAFISDNKESLDSIYTRVDGLELLDNFQQQMIEYMQNAYSEAMKMRNLENCSQFIKEAIMFEFARNLYSFGEAYQVYLMNDDGFLQAVQIMNDDKIFKKFKVDY